MSILTIWLVEALFPGRRRLVTYPLKTTCSRYKTKKVVFATYSSNFEMKICNYDRSSVKEFDASITTRHRTKTESYNQRVWMKCIYTRLQIYFQRGNIYKYAIFKQSFGCVYSSSCCCCCCLQLISTSILVDFASFFIRIQIPLLLLLLLLLIIH